MKISAQASFLALALSLVLSGNMLPGNTQEIISGIRPGDQVVVNALVLQDTVQK